jgi:hypothetical protein
MIYTTKQTLGEPWCALVRERSRLDFRLSEGGTCTHTVRLVYVDDV